MSLNPWCLLALPVLWHDFPAVWPLHTYAHEANKCCLKYGSDLGGTLLPTVAFLFVIIQAGFPVLTEAPWFSYSPSQHLTTLLSRQLSGKWICSERAVLECRILKTAT